MGTDGAVYPFWSPDGRSLGFFAGGALKHLHPETSMMCAICKEDEVRSGKATVVFEREGTTVVIKEVLALICDNCGEEYVDEFVTRELLQAASAAALAGVQVGTSPRNVQPRTRAVARQLN